MYSNNIASDIWKESLHRYVRHARCSLKRENARSDLEKLCKKAADLAIMFRASSIEYQWEQDVSLLQGLDVVPNEHEIVGTEGPDPSQDKNIEISMIIFGGVVRGEKSTGLLANGRTRLSLTQVVVRRREIDK
jgi:hypothetical protein